MGAHQSKALEPHQMQSRRKACKESQDGREIKLMITKIRR